MNLAQWQLSFPVYGYRIQKKIRLYHNGYRQSNNLFINDEFY